MEQQGASTRAGPPRTPPREYDVSTGCKAQRSKSSSRKSILGRRACRGRSMCRGKWKVDRRIRTQLTRLMQTEPQLESGVLHHAVAASWSGCVPGEPCRQVDSSGSHRKRFSIEEKEDTFPNSFHTPHSYLTLELVPFCLLGNHSYPFKSHPTYAKCSWFSKGRDPI